MEKSLKYSMGLAALAAVGLVAYVGLNTYQRPEPKKHKSLGPDVPKPNARDDIINDICRMSRQSTAEEIAKSPILGSRKHNPLRMPAQVIKHETVETCNTDEFDLFTCLFVLGRTSFQYLDSVSAFGKRVVTARFDDDVEHVFVDNGECVAYTATEVKTQKIVDHTTDPDAIMKRMSMVVDRIEVIKKT